jgi:hypothetical protein
VSTITQKVKNRPIWSPCFGSTTLGREVQATYMCMYICPPANFQKCFHCSYPFTDVRIRHPKIHACWQTSSFVTRTSGCYATMSVPNWRLPKCWLINADVDWFDPRPPQVLGARQGLVGSLVVLCKIETCQVSLGPSCFRALGNDKPFRTKTFCKYRFTI